MFSLFSISDSDIQQDDLNPSDDSLSPQMLACCGESDISAQVPVLPDVSDEDEDAEESSDEQLIGATL